MIRRRMRTRRIVMLAFPDAQIIDITGPLEVFGRAARLMTDERGWRVPAYTVEIAATKAGPLRLRPGIRLIADRSIAQVRGPIDTLLVAGGRGTTDALRDRALIDWLRAEHRSHAPPLLGVHGSVSARGGRSARRTVGDDPLAAMRAARDAVSGGLGRDRSDFRARGKNIHLGRRDRGNRSGAGVCSRTITAAMLPWRWRASSSCSCAVRAGSRSFPCSSARSRRIASLSAICSDGLQTILAPTCRLKRSRGAPR